MGSAHLSRSLDDSPRSLQPHPCGRTSPHPPLARRRAYLVLDLGGEPVGRALVEVGHGGSDDGKGMRSDSGGSVALGVPAPSPSGGRAGDARARSSARRGRSRNAADRRMMPRRSVGLESRGSSEASWSADGCTARCQLHRSTRSAPSRVHYPLPRPQASGDWPANPTNRAPPPPPPCSGASRPMAARRARRSLPRVPAPDPALTPLKTSVPLLQASPRAAAAPPRRLGGFPAAAVLINSKASVALPLWWGQEAPRGGPLLTGHSIRLLAGHSAPRC